MYSQILYLQIIDTLNSGTINFIRSYFIMHNTVPCRYCREPVHPQATKCPKCGEKLTGNARFERTTKKIVSTIGMFTAFLSVFFATREGYFYVEQKQQQRERFPAHMNAADHFLKLDNLHYAEASLEQALQLSSNDKQLQLKFFLIRSRNILREVDYYGSHLPDEQLNGLPKLITAGFSLTEYNYLPVEEAILFNFLARLLQYDKRWQNPAAIGELFRKARKIDPMNPDIAYWYGDWLLNQEPPAEEGLALIKEAVNRTQDNAFYLWGLGLYQAKRGNYGSALSTLKKAIDLKPKQQSLQRIRASNEAKNSFRRILLKASGKADITESKFFGLDMEQRSSYVQFSLKHSSGSRGLQWQAARLFHSTGKSEQAEILVKKILGNYNERSKIQHLDLLEDILQAQQKTEEAQKVSNLITRKKELESYEEILETGYRDKHRYKVGLRVARQNKEEGIEVLKVFKGYPFAKAGVQPGDRLLEFAHRRITSLRSIWVPINDFTPGTDVPLKINRGGKEINLVVLIE